MTQCKPEHKNTSPLMKCPVYGRFPFISFCRDWIFTRYGFSGTVPGPELRIQQGDHIQVTLVNNLPAAISIHWHGINVPNAADGIAGVTQDAVQPGQSYTYDFIATGPGTYWYHSHQDTSNQIPRGLLGSLIVEPQNLPHYDYDYTLIYHDYIVLSREFFPIVEKIAGNVDEDAIAVNRTNGELRLSAVPSELVRLRLINGTAGEHRAFGDPLRIVPLGVSYRVAALDGHDLNEPQEISAHILPIGAGQRYDLVFRMPDSGAVRLLTEDQNTTVTLGQGEISIPVDEAVHRELMRAYAFAGHRHDALRQYQLCAQALAAEFDLLPEPETTALYTQIINGELAAPASSPAPVWIPPTPIVVEIERSNPFVGRDSELEAVRLKLARAWQGPGQTILFKGDAGVGKTRLAYETIRAAAASGMITLVGAAYEQEEEWAIRRTPIPNCVMMGIEVDLDSFRFWLKPPRPNRSARRQSPPPNLRQP